MRFLLALLLLFLSKSLSASNYDWGKTGHRVTGAIAEKYLTKKTKRNLDKLLNGESLALISTYADEIKSEDKYRPYGPWHYVNVPFDSTYEEHPKSEKGDLIQGIDHCLKVLNNDNSSKEDKIFNLKMLVHLIGDLHQPMHVGLSEDKGGNDFQVRWFGEGTNLHSVWDTKMIEGYGMSYKELADNAARLTKKQRKAIAQGTHREWMEESRGLVKNVYDNTKKGEKLGYRYSYDYFDTVRSQLQKGGIRLAKVLNEIFG
ncbi:S1/P1 Nuclease [Dokdonia sinensis]|uniref:S1/P1 Nuclease n=1 Tax=Dokdonia sinensis TaxID=2479847 RepID=A0A3M0G8Y4_9FLAO|nr:S1/P1 nuclease [Dokdonia sinensis]RMB60627.1 S1/P1 Nuclease [Dokdonia sinensis]